ncbi:MAG: hypothetical protein H0T09_00550 [Actinobacteria bacterium]|nr:hypothetical protein [Actinomycetota bacterium]
MAVAAPLRAPARAARATPRRSLRPRPRNSTRVVGGVVSIGVLAALLAGLVALNVAVLQLNLELDEAGRERTILIAENAALESRVSSATAVARIQAVARDRLGFVPADPEQTKYEDLRVGSGRR